MDDSCVGKTFGIFEVMYECDYRDKQGKKLYHIRCMKCGWENDCRKFDIGRRSQVCSHLGVEGKYRRYIANSVWSNHRLERIFVGIRNRCYNPKNKNFRFYGGKGIAVYDEWLEKPESFEKWALENGYNDGLTIDRVDCRGDYCPANCRWVTKEENSRYKSTTRAIKLPNGEIYSGRKLAKKLNIGENAINRMMREYPEDKVIAFAVARESDMEKKIGKNEKWMEAYGIA